MRNLRPNNSPLNVVQRNRKQGVVIMKFFSRLLFILLISMLLFGCGENTSSIEGKIVDGKGKAISGVTVIFKQVQHTKGYEQFETKTGPNGSFQMPGFSPSSQYVLTLLSDKWTSKFSRKIKTPEAGRTLALTPPIKIRFQHMKNATVIDTRTGLQWKIYPVKDMTAITVLEKVKSLNEGGFSDWRLPTRDELAGLVEVNDPAKIPAAQPPVVKTCCAWVVDPNTGDVDWKFYIEEDNDLWASSKDTPDNRIVIVRTPDPAPAALTVPPPDAIPSPTGQKEPKAFAEKKAQTVRLDGPAATPAPSASLAPTVSKDAVKVGDKSSGLKKEAVKPPAAQTKKTEPVTVAQSGASTAIEILYFETGSTKLSAQELVKLKTFYSKIKGNKGTVVITGHTDAS